MTGLIVGAGFACSVLAERMASQRGKTVLVIDKRDHIGGNACDHLDDAGIMILRYGPHIFHTNAQAVVTYLSQFTSWRAYEHRVLTQVDRQLLPIPINLDTLNRLYGLTLDSDGMEAFLAERRIPIDDIQTSEDVVLSAVGRELYEKLFRGYTRKQWGLDASQLSRAVTARVPTRTNRDDRYFSDTFQQMPADGYTAMFRNMLDHPNIRVELGTAWSEVRDLARARRIIFTGPIDEYFRHQYDALPYRSLRFVHETRDVEWAQPVAVVNYPQTEDYTRNTEYKHQTGQVHPKTSLRFEYPTDEGDPYYPVPREENQYLYRPYRLYRPAAVRSPDVWFVGRLGSYQYLDMDQVVGQALATFDRINGTRAPTAFAPAAE